MDMQYPNMDTPLSYYGHAVKWGDLGQWGDLGHLQDF